ncbi:glycosyltransferase [Pseudohoeflea coraliihabitans]|uniref:Glycosyltransferase n=1 Tax=Pseudohoeflea coraliihabitans TaxID=2860393 RepID=A0ABS6WK23_9HYPH|nr:glycosyltransferase [Pseudohoeflea sp. DP4N28-3]MBW3096003.1 glycosyltransferase [Pseudohoeflea sp. DP4N28-3]
MALSSPRRLPRIIHQTWRDKHVPAELGDPGSWRALNPGWDYRFWTDDDLLEFFETERPDLLNLYLSYQRPVQRADLARYCLLARYGGIYADIDTRCVGSLEPLVGETRAVLCAEPPAHDEPARVRGLERLWFNGTMASPPGHPLWDQVIDLCQRMAFRHAHDVLETTGPLILSAAVAQSADPSGLALNSSGLFAPLAVDGGYCDDPAFGPYGQLRLSQHLWKGTWYKSRHESWYRRQIGKLRKLRHRHFAGARLDPAAMRRNINPDGLTDPLPVSDATPEVAILIPVRDAAEVLPRCFELLRSLDHPHSRLHLVFGHGASRDDSAGLIDGFLASHAAAFASARRIELPREGPAFTDADRWKPEKQRHRRAGLARARNDMLAAALPLPVKWILWIDADMVAYPPDLVARLLAARERIVTPDCVLEPGGLSFDLNTFLSVYTPSRTEYYRHVRDGLLQPPEDWWFRRHLHDLRYLEMVPLHGVGATVLLVHASVHRAGIHFPELPYRDLIETEGFGQLARDLGVVPVGLPQLEVVHARR